MWDDTIYLYDGSYRNWVREQRILEGWVKLHGEWIESRMKSMLHQAWIAISRRIVFTNPARNDTRWSANRWKSKT